MRVMYSINEEPCVTYYYTLEVTEAESLDKNDMEARVREMHAEESGVEQTLDMNNTIKKVGTL
jgi:hypothetical protein